MFYRQTLFTCADATNARWARTFHLYRGAYKRVASHYTFIRAAVRRVTPPQPIYRNFKVKIYQKGDVARFYIIRARAVKYHRTSYAGRNDALTLKRGLHTRSKYCYGPVPHNVMHKKYIILFAHVITSLFGHNYLYTSELALSAHPADATTLFWETIPTTKLMYPEPFIATASSLHYDLWFVHILLYQYWLWFVFIFLIIFFFLMFLVTIRWCNPRVRPRLETRGVSRSKCADLITACVPVTWATSIIVNETTDAIDFFDGFGTADLVIGVRAYQWGWEYYYPRDIDFLLFNIGTPALHTGNTALISSTTAAYSATQVAHYEQAPHTNYAIPRVNDTCYPFTQAASMLPIFEKNSFFTTRAVRKNYLLTPPHINYSTNIVGNAFWAHNHFATRLVYHGLIYPATSAPQLLSHDMNILNMWAPYWYDYDFKYDLSLTLAADAYWQTFYEWYDVTLISAPRTQTRPYLNAELSFHNQSIAHTALHKLLNTSPAPFSLKNASNAWFMQAAPLLYSNAFSFFTMDANNVTPTAQTLTFTNANTAYTRSAIRNLLIATGAVQKVFKARLDDAKSFLTLVDIASNDMPLPLLESGAYYTPRWFTKHSAPHVQYITYNAVPRSEILNNIVFTLCDARPLPFMFFSAIQSDAARYIWLDWYARWGSVSVQPASHSRYTLFGVPHLNGGRITNGRDLWLETETYFMRLARSRRAMHTAQGLGATYYPIWSHVSSTYQNTSYLAINAYLWESFLATISDTQILNFNVNAISDTAARATYGPNTALLDMLFIKWSQARNYSIAQIQPTFVKDAHIPLKKGINNLIRLHATGAIAFPTEIRINILASSKDVIHSWAIPSAGIKIDCIPGYSSHRTFLFLLSGIFWGQCMEICGRYHHWMPIVLFFMKRDLFFLWCSHFIFTNDNNTERAGLQIHALKSAAPAAYAVSL